MVQCMKNFVSLNAAVFVTEVNMENIIFDDNKMIYDLYTKMNI